MNWITNEIEEIKETWYISGTVPKFDSAVREYYENTRLDWLQYDYTEIVYYVQATKITILTLNHTNTKPVTSFQFGDYLRKLPDISLNCFNYICTFYYRRNFEGEEDWLFISYEGPNPHINALTKDTFGRIVFNYQAAYLYGLLSGTGHEEAVDWVKRMSTNELYSVVDAINVEISEDENMYNIWEAYTKANRTFTPNRFGAKRLMKFIQKHNRI